jgi:hypothetical protein
MLDYVLGHWVLSVRRPTHRAPQRLETCLLEMWSQAGGVVFAGWRVEFYPQVGAGAIPLVNQKVLNPIPVWGAKLFDFDILPSG